MLIKGFGVGKGGGEQEEGDVLVQFREVVAFVSKVLGTFVLFMRES